MNFKTKLAPRDLAHHGVKGQKWGVRKAEPTTSDINDARARQMARRDAHIQAIHRLNLVAETGTESQKKAAVRDYQKTANDFLNSEDRVTAAHMTRGEKVASALLGGPVGLIIISHNKSTVKSIAKSVDENRKAS